MRNSDAPLIPGPFWHRLEEFVRENRTGHMTLHIKEGNILAYELLESGRLPLDKDCNHLVD